MALWLHIAAHDTKDKLRLVIAGNHGRDDGVSEGVGIVGEPGSKAEASDKKVGFGLTTGDVEADMIAIKAFYAPFKGKNPDQF